MYIQVLPGNWEQIIIKRKRFSRIKKERRGGDFCFPFYWPVDSVSSLTDKWDDFRDSFAYLISAYCNIVFSVSQIFALTEHQRSVPCTASYQCTKSDGKNITRDILRFIPRCHKHTPHFGVITWGYLNQFLSLQKISITLLPRIVKTFVIQNINPDIKFIFWMMFPSEPKFGRYIN